MYAIPCVIAGITFSQKSRTPLSYHFYLYYYIKYCCYVSYIFCLELLVGNKGINNKCWVWFVIRFLLNV